ncbi:MAG: HYR domain-containing protein [Bacteroidota bacterium]
MPPMITCPADVVLNIPVGDFTAVAGDLSPTVSENCSDVSLTYFTTGATVLAGSGTLSDSTFNLGSTIVNYVATDAAGLTDTCSFEILVRESLVILDCPEPIMTFTTEETCRSEVLGDTVNIQILSGEEALDSSVYNVTRPDGTMFAPILTVQPPFVFDNLAGRTFAKGTTTIEAIFYDTTGNNTVCTYQVIVQDTVPPSIDCPADVMASVSGSDTAIVINNLAPIPFDNCDTTIVTYSTMGATMLSGEDDISGSSFNVGTTVVTYFVVDESGNQDSCSFNVVVETVSVELACPSDTTIITDAEICGATTDILNIDVLIGGELIDSVSYTLSGATQATQTGDSILTLSNIVFNEGLTDVQIEVFDSLNSLLTLCAFEVNVVDSIAPTFVCPSDLTERIASTDTIAVLSLPLLEASDNCSDSAALNITYELTGATEAQGFGDIDSLTFNVGTTSVQYFVSDETGNIDSCLFNLTVEQAAIDIICPDDVTVSSMMDTCGAIVNDIGLMVLDTGALNLTTYILSGATDSVFTDTVLVDASGLFFNLDTTLVTYMVADTTGASESCSFNVIVIDDLAPSLICPMDFSVSIPEGDTVGIVSGTDLLGLITDNCDGEPSVTYILSGATVDTGMIDTSDIIFNLDTTTVTYFVEDAAGNRDSCSFNVNVTTSPLEIVCPPNQSLAAVADTCANVVNDIAVMVQDTGAIATITYDFSGATSLDSMGMGDASGSTFNGGTTTVTYTVTDTLGNQAMCTFDVTILDESAPMLLCPDSLRVNIPEGVDTAVVNGLDPIVMDNCDPMPMLSFSTNGRTNISETEGSASGFTFARGATVITYTATDADGNTATCTFPIQLGDFSVEVACATDTTVNRLEGECGRVVDIASTIDRPDRIAKIDYNLSGATTGLITVDEAPFALSTLFNEDTTLVNYNVSTIARDTFACEIEVVVLDTVPMLFENCPTDLVLNTVVDTNFAIAAWTPPTLTDSCGAIVTATHNPGDTLMLGVTEVSYFASNAQGETDTCTFLVTVQDSVAPFSFVNCPTDTVLQLAADTCSIAYSWTEPTLSDDRPLDTLFSNFNPGDLFVPDTNLVTYTAVSTMGDTAICSFNVVVQDTIAPILVDCPSDTAFVSNANACGRIVNWTPPTVLDACEVSLTSNIEPGTPLPVGIDTVTYTAIDLSGNEATCSFVVQVIDQTPPRLVNCPDTVRVGLQADNCEVPVTWQDISATDNCTEGLLITSTHMSGDTFPSGTTIVTFIATDLSGNADTCSFPVIVGTGAGITEQCPDDITVTAPDSTCQRPVSWTPPAFESECTEFTVTSNFMPSDTFPVGTTEVIYFIEDKRGDTTTCSFNVTVLDEELPMTFGCPQDTTISIGGADCEAVYNWTSPTFTDNCGVTQIDSTHASGDAFPLGETIVRYMAMDGSGNIQICEFTVRVIDEEAPSFVNCPDTVMVRVDGMLMSDPSGIVTGTPVSEDCNEVVLTFDTPMAMDGCDTVSVTQIDNTGLGSGSSFELGTTTLTYVATDSSGNSVECNLVIEVLPFGNIDIIIPDAQFCSGDSITLIAEEVNIPDAVYNWFGAFRANGRIVTVATDDLRDNMAFVEVVAENGCVLTGMTPINVQKNPELVIITNGATCEGSDLMLSAENIVEGFDPTADSIVTWTWSYAGIVDTVVNNQNQLIENATSANSGIYQVTALSAAGCEATITDTITIASKPMAPELNIAPLRDSACVGEEFMLIGTLDATPGITYNFAATPDTGRILMPSDSNITSISFQEAGDYTISYWIDNNGCISDTARLDVFIGQSPNTELRFEGATECVNADSTLQLFETGGEATAWTWLRPDSTVLSNQQNPILPVDSVQNGQYVVIASIGSCETRDTIEVNVSSSLTKPVLSAIDFACTTDTLALSVSQAFDSTVSFVWTSPDTNLILTPIRTDTGYLELFPTQMDSGLMTTVIVQAVADGCVSDFDTISFEVRQGPAVDLSQNIMDYSCISADSLIMLFDAAGEGDKYSWTGPCDFVGTGESPSFLVNFADAECKSGVYKVLVNGENGCEASDSIDIQFTAGLPQLNIVGEPAYCEGEEIVLAVDTLFNDSLEIMWQGPEGFTSMDSIIRISAESFLMGDYTVSILGDSTTCPSVASEPFFVTVLSPPMLENDEFTVVVDQLDSLDVLANDSLLTLSNISTSVTTSPFLGNANFLDNSDKLGYRSNAGAIGNDNFTYEVCYEGCQDKSNTLCAQAIVNVNVVFPPELCVVADFITPNGDSKNDRLIISCAEAGEYPNNELIIFNKWGDEVFRASPYENDWDGTYNGEDLPDGTYYYVFIPEVGLDAQKGFITLFR